MGVTSGEKRRLKFIIDLEILRNILDIPVAFGLAYPYRVPSKVIGLLGTITSIIGIHQKYNE